MADIVERLRAAADIASGTGRIVTDVPSALRAAASEIERLRSALTEIETYLDKRDAALRASERGDIAYVCGRNQHQAHDVLLRTIRESGKSQGDLSKLTGIDEAVISRLLRRPRNMELNTFSKLIYAATGATLRFSLTYPEAKNMEEHPPERNERKGLGP